MVSAGVSVPLLACTECAAVWTPSPEGWGPVDPTGCPSCGAWSWLVATDTAAPGRKPSGTTQSREEIR